MAACVNIRLRLINSKLSTCFRDLRRDSQWWDSSKITTRQYNALTIGYPLLHVPLWRKWSDALQETGKPSRLRNLPSLNDPLRAWCRMWLIRKLPFSWGGPVGGIHPQCSATSTGSPCTTLKRGAPEEPPKVVALWVRKGPVEWMRYVCSVSSVAFTEYVVWKHASTQYFDYFDVCTRSGVHVLLVACIHTCSNL